MSMRKGGRWDGGKEEHERQRSGCGKGAKKKKKKRSIIHEADLKSAALRTANASRHHLVEAQLDTCQPDLFERRKMFHLPDIRLPSSRSGTCPNDSPDS